MEFAPTAEQEGIRAKARRVAEEVCAPTAAHGDAERIFPHKEIQQLAEGGWLGMRVDPQFSGKGLDTVSAALAIEELSRGCASTGMLVGFHNLLVCEVMATTASHDVTEEMLPKLARGEWLGGMAIADPATTGKGTTAVATRLPEGYRLEGVKPFVPGAVGADLFVVYLHTADPDPSQKRERVVLLVPRSTPGLSVGPADPIVGVRASGTAGLSFHDCRIPATYRLGEEAEARGIVKQLLAFANLVVAAQAVGIGAAVLEKAIERAGEHEPGEVLVGSHQSVQFKIADMVLKLDAARLFVLRAARARDAGEEFIYEAAQAKSFCGRAAVEIADAAIQLLGGDGSLADHGIERHWRDAKTCELNPSTREVAQLLVARHLIEESP